MAIKVSGTTVIDDGKNILNVGIMTVGSGSSTITLNSNSQFTVGIGITFNGNNRNISIAGTITTAGLSIPLSLG